MVRRKPTSLSAPLQKKEEFSLFTGPDDLCKVKISPQLLLATQRFLSRGEDDGGSCCSSPLHLHDSGQPPHTFPVPLNMAGLCHQLQWCGLARLCVQGQRVGWKAWVGARTCWTLTCVHAGRGGRFQPTTDLREGPAAPAEAPQRQPGSEV